LASLWKILHSAVLIQSRCRFHFLCYELTYSVVYSANILFSKVLHKMLLIHHHPWLGKSLHPLPGRFQGSWTREAQTCTYFIVNNK
jgi:putative component of membrane protein insertase Oxa1/YidC/SpoIIIJ protein YidD